MYYLHKYEIELNPSANSLDELVTLFKEECNLLLSFVIIKLTQRIHTEHIQICSHTSGFDSTIHPNIKSPFIVVNSIASRMIEFLDSLVCI